MAAQRHGVSFMDNFGAAMTGVKPKSLFLSPRMSIPLGAALLGLLTSRAPTKYASGPRAETKPLTPPVLVHSTEVGNRIQTSAERRASMKVRSKSW